MSEPQIAHVSPEDIRRALPLIRQVARQLHKRMRPMNVDDLFSVGLSTLDDAVRRFEPARSSFRAYLRKRLVWAMTSAFRRQHRQFKSVRGLPIGMSTQSMFDRARPVRVRPVQDEQFLPSLFEFRSEGRLGWLTATGDVSATVVCDRNDPEQELMQRHADAALREAMCELPAAERSIVSQHYFEGRSFSAIASRLRLSRSYVSRAHQRALRRMAEHLERVDNLTGSMALPWSC